MQIPLLWYRSTSKVAPCALQRQEFSKSSVVLSLGSTSPLCAHLFVSCLRLHILNVPWCLIQTSPTLCLVIILLKCYAHKVNSSSVIWLKYMVQRHFCQLHNYSDGVGAVSCYRHSWASLWHGWRTSSMSITVKLCLLLALFLHNLLKGSTYPCYCYPLSLCQLQSFGKACALRGGWGLLVVSWGYWWVLKMDYSAP